MFDDESFDEFYAKLNDIVNSAYNLDEIYDQLKIVRCPNLIDCVMCVGV